LQSLLEYGDIFLRNNRPARSLDFADLYQKLEIVIERTASVVCES
jgi:hypothetical protein